MNRSEQLERLAEALRRAGVDIALLTSPAAITYVSGFEPPLPVGPTQDLAGGYPLALVLLDVAGGYQRLILAEELHSLAKTQSLLDEETPIGFSSFGHFEPVDGQRAYLSTIGRWLKSATASPVTLGLECSHCPVLLFEYVKYEFPNVRLVDVAPILREVRRIKTPGEIERIRAAVRAADAAQMALLDAAQTAGQNEFEVWAEIHARIFQTAGCPVVTVGELVSGPRTALLRYPGGPLDRTIAPGDTAILDISVRVQGYWSDCTNTVVFAADPSRHQLRFFQAAKDAFKAALSHLRPGVPCSEVYEAARHALAGHGFAPRHYMGHQVGASVNEEPRLVPYDTRRVEAGMVFAVEPGAYEGDGGSTGARCERVILVTDQGPEILSTFPWGM